MESSGDVEKNNQAKKFNRNTVSYDRQDFSSAIYHEVFENTEHLKQTVQIKNLRKNFESLHAVDGLSLALYEKQIFCLLGHNGAGKTTTISCLTGMVPKTEGDITICGMDLDDELDVIRQSLGVCLQKDVLYDFLTVEEHLYFLCKLKGREQVEIEN